MSRLVVVARDILAKLTPETFQIREDDRMTESTSDVLTLILTAKDGLHMEVSLAGQLLRTEPESVRGALKHELRYALKRLEEMRAS